MNRALSIRSHKKESSSSHKGGLSFSSLRGSTQPELSKKLYKLIKTENNLISAHETAGKERINIASQLSDWGEGTGDDAVSDLSDKLGVLLSEIGEQEDLYAHNLDDARGTLKAIRNTEKSVQPSRDHKAKISDKIAKLKVKEPESAELVILEQELVRAEAENLVAEAQLTNITRQKIKETYAAEFAATIERAEKQIILARHGYRILSLLDDTPVVPGDARPAFEHADQARQVLNDAEEDLREWRFQGEDLSTAQTHAGLPLEQSHHDAHSEADIATREREDAERVDREEAHEETSGNGRVGNEVPYNGSESGSVTTGPTTLSYQ